MKLLADTRAKQLRDNSGFKDAGVYDPESVGGTHVIYVLHDAKHPEKYGGLPANPQIPVSYTIWKSIFKPVGLFFSMLGFVGVVLHYVFEGPKRPQPAPPVKQIEPPASERKEA
jgi:hypothetical protein